MMKCLYLLAVVFHVAAGCLLSADNLTEITGWQGGSVLLPCSCSDLNTKPQKLTWETYRTERLIEVLNNEHYSGRLQLFNNTSPANLSLLISDLKEEDQRFYRCRTEEKLKDIMLYVKGCELVKKTEVEHVTVFTGESVVLPCVCTDIQNKSQGLKWQFFRINQYQEIYPKQTGHHRNRVKLVSNNSQGNLSLLMSHLTEEDQGDYRCSVHGDRKDIRLSVRGRKETSINLRKTNTTPSSKQPQSKTTNSPPASSSTTLEQDTQQTHSNLPLIFGISVVLLLVILAVVALICWRCRGQRYREKANTDEYGDYQDCKIMQKTVPDAIYANITYIHTAGAACTQTDAEEENEYSIIAN